MGIDAIDLNILKYLQENARLSNQELAEMVNLSTSACHRRVKILEEKGIIEKYQARVNYEKLGIKVFAIVEIKLLQLTENHHEYFLEQICDFEEVVNAFIITGDKNYVLFIATKDLNSFSEFLIHKLNQIKGISEINSKIILDTIMKKQIF